MNHTLRSTNSSKMGATLVSPQNNAHPFGTQRAHSQASGASKIGGNNRMRELIVSNFLKKYLASRSPRTAQEFQSPAFYLRLQSTLGEQVEAYLTRANVTTNRSVKVLEDILWETAQAMNGGSTTLPRLESGS